MRHIILKAVTVRPKQLILGTLSAGILLLLIVVGRYLWPGRMHRVARAFEPTAALPEGALPVLWTVPGFSFLDQDGQVVTEGSLRGRVWIADFIFTRCNTVCPTITAKMMLLRRSIERSDLRFVSFSVDPDFDTPAILKAYASRWNGDERWQLLSTSAKVSEFARAMMVPIQSAADPDSPIVHSDSFFLVDRNGHVRGHYDSLDEFDMKSLLADANALDIAVDGSGARSADVVRVRASSPSTSPSGLALFHSLGCAACHDNSRLAPPLGGLSGQTITFNEGATAVVDRAYLQESILNAGAKVVSGYTTFMPSYRGQISNAQVDELVDYIESLPSAVPPRAAEQVRDDSPSEQSRQVAEGKAVDPVCGMDTTINPTQPHAEYRGKTYFFCSDVCRDRFVSNPEKYTR